MGNRSHLSTALARVPVGETAPGIVAVGEAARTLRSWSPGCHTPTQEPAWGARRAAWSSPTARWYRVSKVPRFLEEPPYQRFSR